MASPCGNLVRGRAAFSHETRAAFSQTMRGLAFDSGTSRRRCKPCTGGFYGPGGTERGHHEHNVTGQPCIHGMKKFGLPGCVRKVGNQR